MAYPSHFLKILDNEFKETQNLINSFNHPELKKLYQAEFDKLQRAFSFFLLKHIPSENEPVSVIPHRIFTSWELNKFYNGQNGYPFYITAQGYVFDVTHISPWNQGVFASLQRNVNPKDYFCAYHQNNLTEMIKTAPILGRLIG